MKLLLVLYLSALAAAYDDIDDNYYIKLLDNRSELEKFFKCLVDLGPCDSDFGKHAKTHVTEFFADGCNECDDRQKHYSHLMILILKNDFPDLYKALQAKYNLKVNSVRKVQEKLKNF